MEDSQALLLQAACLTEQGLQLPRGQKALQVRVAANGLLADEDVWDSALVRQILKRILQGGAISCTSALVHVPSPWEPADGLTRRGVVELYNLELGVQAGEGLLGSTTVRAVGLGEDNCTIGR